MLVHRIEPNAQFGYSVPRSLKNLVLYSLIMEETTQLREKLYICNHMPGENSKLATAYRLIEYDSKRKSSVKALVS